MGAAFTFATLRAALEANVAILETGPSAVEFLDLEPLRRAPNLAQYRSLASLLDGTDAALLTVEYQGSDEEALAGLARLRALAGASGAAQTVWLEEPEALAEAAALRRAVLPLLMGAPGAERPAAFVEDTAVAPERLADFVADLQSDRRVPRRARQLHRSRVRRLPAPPADARPQDGGRRGAHGAARRRGRTRWSPATTARSPASTAAAARAAGSCRELLGPGLYEAMVAVKDAFDPRRLLNPGVVVGGPPVGRVTCASAPTTAATAAGRRASPTPPRAASAPAVEKCFGAGLCKKLTGTMCPPAAATRDEARSTRARANALQGVVCGAVPLAAIGEDEFRDVLGTCVACKACKTECPAGVDMAALKVEWLAELRAREGVPPLARGIGDFRRLAALAAPVGAAGQRARPHAGGARS